MTFVGTGFQHRKAQAANLSMRLRKFYSRLRLGLWLRSGVQTAETSASWRSHSVAKALQASMSSCVNSG